MTKVITGLVLAMSFCGHAFACDKPDPPDLPDPNTAVTAQMVKAQNDVKTFMSKAEEYLECIRSDARHNEMVDEMHQVADTFNNSIKMYKSRMDAT